MARHYPQGARTTFGGTPADAAQGAQPKEKKNVNKDQEELSDEQKKLHVDRQNALAKRILAEQKSDTARHQDAHTDAVLTVDSHVGKRPDEPDKPREDEARKVDLGAVTGDTDVHTVPLETGDKGVTDHVVVAPEGANAAVAAPHPESYPQKVAKAASRHAKKGGKSQARESEQGSAEGDGAETDGGGKKKAAGKK